MPLAGLSQKEILQVSRSLGTQNTNYIPELTPVEVGEKLTKSKEAGSKLKDLSETFKVNISVISEHISIFENLNSSLFHHVYYSKQDEYSKAGKVGYDKARIIARFPKKMQEKVLLSTLDNGFTRADIQSVKQLLDRSGRKLPSILQEIVDRKGLQIVTSFIGFISDKKTQDYLTNFTQLERNKILDQIINKKNINDLFRSEGKKPLSSSCGEKSYTITIPGKYLSRDFKDQLDRKINKGLNNAARKS